LKASTLSLSFSMTRTDLPVPFLPPLVESFPLRSVFFRGSPRMSVPANFLFAACGGSLFAPGQAVSLSLWTPPSFFANITRTVIEPKQHGSPNATAFAGFLFLFHHLAPALVIPCRLFHLPDVHETGDGEANGPLLVFSVSKARRRFWCIPQRHLVDRPQPCCMVRGRNASGSLFSWSS